MFFRSNILDKNTYWDFRISAGCVIYFLMSVLNATIKTVLPDSGIVTILSLLTGIVIMVGFIQCLPAVFKRNQKLLLSSYFLFVFVYGISYLLISLRGENTDVMLKGSALLTFAFWIPLGVFSTSVYNKSILYNVFLKASFPILAMLTLMFLIHPHNENEVAEYNMFFGINMLIPIMFHLNELFKSRALVSKKKKFLYLIMFIIEFAMVFIYANRGCLIPIVFILIYKLFLESKKRASVVLPIIILIGFFVYFFGEGILSFIAALFDNYGISSRTLWYILSGEISDPSGRDEIWKNSLEMIFERPVLGWGLGGEFYRLADYEGAIKVDNSFTPHNGVLQNMVNFGVFIGTIVSLLIIIPYFKIKRIKNIYYHDLVLIFGSAIVAIFYSASGFFTNPMVAIFLYLSYFSCQSKKISLNR